MSRTVAIEAVEELMEVVLGRSSGEDGHGLVEFLEGRARQGRSAGSFQLIGLGRDRREAWVKGAPAYR